MRMMGNGRNVKRKAGNEMELTESMMEMLRGRRGLDEDDTSQDDGIRAMAPSVIVRECTAWELGDGAWATRIARWMDKAGCTVVDMCL